MADRNALIKGFLRRNPKAGKPGPGNRITEDDPRWNPRTMGNKRSGAGSDPRRPYQEFVGVNGKISSAPAGSGPLNPVRSRSKYYLGKGAHEYSKGKGRPD